MGLFDIFKKKSSDIPLQQIVKEIPALQFVSLFYGNKPDTNEVPSQSTVQEIDSNEPIPQFVSLFYENKPDINKETILFELKFRFKNAKFLDGELPLIFYVPDYRVDSIPVKALISNPSSEISLGNFKRAFQQSLHWSEAREVLEKCRFEINLTDFLSNNLEHENRLDFFQRFVCSVVKATKPSIIYYRNSEKLLKPDDFLEGCDKNYRDILSGAMSIRFFNVGNGEVLIDTLGLHAFGLADFECRFSKYDPSEIAEALTNVADYIFAVRNEDRSISTIQGIGKNPIWKTRYEEAKAEPTRLVVNVIPNY